MTEGEATQPGDSSAVRPVSRRVWAGTLVAAVIYFGLGASPTVEVAAGAWIYKIGLTVATVASLAFLVLYTSYGLVVRDSPRWWRTDLTTALVFVVGALTPGFGALAYTFWFKGGNLQLGYLAWTALSGPVIESPALVWLTVRWYLNLELERRFFLERRRRASRALCRRSAPYEQQGQAGRAPGDP